MPRRLLAALLATIAAPALAEVPVLSVLTYDSFVPEWGPGPAIEAGFEATCGCDLRFVAAGDGAALLARLRLEGPASAADVVLGLDTSLIAEATASGLFAPQPARANDLPVAFSDPHFIPFDWGWFAMVYDRSRLATPPTDFKALAASSLKIVIQDPRSSTPGLGLLLWVKAAYGEGADAVWAALADNIVTVTPGWSEAYALFLAGEADMVLSYTTSPAYHLIAEDDATKAAAPFREGHYLQVEVAGVLAASDQPALAADFIAYLTGPAAQSALITTNWMYPAFAPDEALPAGFETLITPETSLLMTPQQAFSARGPAIAEWLAALSQ